MKLEMGEFLAYSWLKHVKGCHVVQMNWKCPKIDTKDKLPKEFSELKKEFEMKFSDYDVFGKNKIGQFIKQAECDVIGVKFMESEESIDHIFMVEVAFHKAGLNYKDKNNKGKGPVAKVLSKFIRLVFIWKLFFPNKHVTIIFATPKISHNHKENINKLLNKLREIIKSKEWDNVVIDFISDEKFYSDIIDETNKKSKGYTDTSELYLRGKQLFELRDRKK